MKRFRVLMTVLVVFALVMTVAGCSSGTKTAYPDKAITVVVRGSGGGGTDLIARAIAKGAEKQLGQTMSVVDKPGGSGAVGLGEVKAAKADGYTLAVLPIELGFLDKQGIYPFGVQDFEPIILINSDPAALTVKKDAAWKDAKEFIAYAKANPGKVKIGHSGAGLLWHLAGAALGKKADVKFTFVPFDGAAPAIAALMGGQIDAVTVSGAEVSAQVKGGNLKVLGIFDDKKMAIFPDAPTLKEQGFDVNISTFRGIGGPKGLPADVVTKLHDAFKKAMDDPEYAATLNKLGLGIKYMNAKDYKALSDKTASDFEGLLKDIGLYKK